MGEFLTKDELLTAGFSRVGENVRVSSKCAFYGVRGSLGSNVRIDDFCIFKGHIEIGSYVHVAGFCVMSGNCGVVRMEDFSGVALRVTVYTGTDTYGESILSNSTVPEKFKKTKVGDVVLAEGSLIGAHCVILPGIKVGRCASVGAMCVIHKDVPDGTCVISRAAVPQVIGTRDVEIMGRMMQEVRNG